MQFGLAFLITESRGNSWCPCLFKLVEEHPSLLKIQCVMGRLQCNGKKDHLVNHQPQLTFCVFDLISGLNSKIEQFKVCEQ